MTTQASLFVLAAVVLAVLSLAWVLSPLWRQSRATGLALVAALLVLTGSLYFVLGTPAALDPSARRNEMPATLDDAIAQLEAKLAEDPAQPEGWRLLANAYLTQGNTGKAGQAFAKALSQSPDDPDLLAEAAEARAMADPERRFDGAAVSMLERAVELQPMHQRARWFLGIARRQAGDARAAAETWAPLLGAVDASTARPLREQIALARQEAGLPPLADDAGAPPPGITVSVSLDPAVGADVPGNATLFVIARQPGGPPMPVAVKRLPASQLPTTVTLGDGDSPMPTMKLSQLERVELVARISRSGNATPAPGDLASSPVQVDLGDGAKAALLIDQAVP
ncbi:tetratricopeptide repeat protein [Lysobacter sp. SG-8]|uniref:Tetratricopeptide repeat protein n=1 Tax=Marilutibacter penaei TaxID=2759900 RepID=A0A7W3YDR4_9GAMM|nr:tetratricopeptide repeat protein [Lysobacter penaei]MBB1087540.1 tetratricopeptide repeat protein [Lysobacter penaei]